jgi:hypothetical protein
MPAPVNADLDFGSTARIINLPDPTAAQHAATRAYVDSVVEGLAWKDSVRVASQANVTLASPGATIDGITMTTNDRVLIRSQSTTSENGIYIWNGAATPMTRSLDANTAAELEQAVVTVEEGTSAASTFRQTLVNFTLGAGAINWTSFGTGAPSASETTAGIAEIATQTETDTGTDDLRFVTPLKLATWAGRIRRFAQDLGDGSATSIAINHNLNTRDVEVYVYETGGSRRQVLCEVQHTTVNQVTLLFASAPALNSLRIVVIG